MRTLSRAWRRTAIGGPVIGCEAARTGRREKEPEGKRRRRSCERRPRLSTRQEDLVALQLPPPCGLVHVPDIDVPRTLPLYFAPTLTAPNLIFPSCTLPPML